MHSRNTFTSKSVLILAGVICVMTLFACAGCGQSAGSEMDEGPADGQIGDVGEDKDTSQEPEDAGRPELSAIEPPGAGGESVRWTRAPEESEGSPGISGSRAVADDVLLETPIAGWRARVCVRGRYYPNSGIVTLTSTNEDGYQTRVETEIQHEGYFEFRGIPVGLYDAEFAVPDLSASSYREVWRDIEILPGYHDWSTAPGIRCLTRRERDIAVLVGTGDSIADILRNFGLQPEIQEGDTAVPGKEHLLLNRDRLLELDVIAIGDGQWRAWLSGLSAAQEQALRANLIAFVNSGGHLTVTGEAAMIVELAFPDALDLYGEPDGSGSLIGDVGNVVASAETQIAQIIVWGYEVQVEFSARFWPVVKAAGVLTEVHLEADVPILNEEGVAQSTPILLSYRLNQNSGAVLVCSFKLKDLPVSVAEDLLSFAAFQL